MFRKKTFPPGLKDEVIEKLTLRLKLKPVDLDRMFALFSKYDADQSGSMDVDEFYRLLREPHSPFGDALFELVNLDEDTGSISFSEFMSTVCTYVCFSIEDILQFAFNIVDTDKSGFVSIKELNALATWLHEKPPTNVRTALEQIQAKFDEGDGEISYTHFRTIHTTYPFLLHPAFRLQESMMDVVLGKSWWMAKKKELGLIKEPVEPSIFDNLPSLKAILPQLSINKVQAAEEDEDMNVTGANAFDFKLHGGPELREHVLQLQRNREYEEEEERKLDKRRRRYKKQQREADEKHFQLVTQRIQKRRQRALIFSTNPNSNLSVSLVHTPIPPVRLFPKKANQER